MSTLFPIIWDKFYACRSPADRLDFQCTQFSDWTSANRFLTRTYKHGEYTTVVRVNKFHPWKESVIRDHIAHDLINPILVKD